MKAQELLSFPGEKKAISVSELTRRLKNLLEEGIPYVCVDGELSKPTYHTSGHLYFDLKDDQSIVHCVMWRSSVQRLKFTVEHGLQVIACGTISVYEPRGQYQLYVQTIDPKGAGALQLRFEQLKARLEAEGLFDPARKRPIPFFPKRIAIVTSPVGSVLHDMVNTIHKRCPKMNTVIYPVKVQGEGAAEEIAAAIGEINLAGLGVDVMIVGRGGGSVEDLWAFNEEVVARAISGSRIPVVSAVGHETDFTIADFVADVRAKTPTDAGTLVVPIVEDLLRQLDMFETTLQSFLRSRTDRLRTLLDGTRDSHALRRPEMIVQQCGQRLDELQDRARVALANAAQQMRRRLDGLGTSAGFAWPRVLARESRKRLTELQRTLVSEWSHALQTAQERVRSLAAQLDSVNPLRVLARGYSITTKEGRVVKSSRDVCSGDEIQTQLHHGVIRSRVTGIDEPA